MQGNWSTDPTKYKGGTGSFAVAENEPTAAAGALYLITGFNWNYKQNKTCIKICAAIGQT